MNPLWVAGAALTLWLLLREQGARSAQTVQIASTDEGGHVTLDDLFRQYGDAYGLDWTLLKAIATVESGLNPNAVNPRDPSYGLMQILCTGDGGPCGNKLYVDKWPPMRREDLFDPEINLMYACQILNWNLTTFGIPRGIAVYNSWEARQAPENGPFPNQAYVDKVLAQWNRLKPSPVA